MELRMGHLTKLSNLTFLLLFLYLTSTRTEATNVAYFIQVSEATLPLVPRLLRTIWHSDNTYVLHFDAKIPGWQKDFTITAAKSHVKQQNVHIMESEVITYRGISMVINTMNAMQKAIDVGNWDYFINISGADYPLVSPENQRELLTPFANRNASFIMLASRKWADQAKSFRASRLFTDTSLAMNGNISALVDSYSPHPLLHIMGYKYCAAEAWMILHRTFVEYLLKAPKARRFYTAFAYTAEPEEHFFPTVAYNTPRFNATLVPDAMRAIFWKSPTGKRAGQHPFLVDERSADKWVFLESLSRSGAFFARKISKPNSQLLDIIDAQISGVNKKHLVQSKVDDFLRHVKKRLANKGRNVL